MAAAAGKRYFPAEIRSRLDQLRGSPEAYFKILSEFDQQLVTLLCAGHSYQEIARKIGSCEGTIRGRFHRIMEKTGARPRAALMCWGQRVGFSANPFFGDNRNGTDADPRGRGPKAGQADI